MPKKANTPKIGDNVSVPPVANPDEAVVNNPVEGKPDLTKLPTFDADKVALELHPQAPVRQTITLGSGSVREDR